MFALVWTNFKRKKGRLALTLLSVLIAFLLFGVLMAVRQGFTADLGGSASRRLVTVNKVAPFAPMPVAYAARIAHIPGVKAVTYADAMVGFYQNHQNFVLMLAVPAESFFQADPEIVVPPAQRKTWSADRTGALATPALLKAYGWKVGQRVPLTSTMQKKDGTTSWTVTIDGTLTNSEHPDSGARQLIIHYKYLNEARATGADQVASFTVLPAEGADMTQVSKAIDNEFANASPQTRTSTAEATFRKIYQQAGNVGAILVDVAIAVFFSMLLVIGAIMLQSTRERRTEFATLRALGFGRGTILGMVLGESVLTCLVGGLVGLGLAAALVSALQHPLAQYLPTMALTGAAAAIAVGLMIGFGLLSGALPAGQMWRLSIRDALGRV